MVCTRATTCTPAVMQVVGLGSCAGGCTVRDVWQQTALPSTTTGIAARLAPHDSLLVVVGSPSPAPPPPPPYPPPPPPPPPSPPGAISKGVLFDSRKPGNELIDATWVNVTATTEACLALCTGMNSMPQVGGPGAVDGSAGAAGRCAGVSYRIRLKHCWLHRGCALPSRDPAFNSALV